MIQAVEFDDIFELLMKSEGGGRITRDPLDMGGLTKWGISKRAHPTVDIENLTKKGAKIITKKHYWDKLEAEKIPEGIRYMAVDCAFLQGEYFSKKTIHEICDITILEPIGQLIKFRDERIERLKLNKTYYRFGNGWINRVEFVTNVCKQNLRPAKGFVYEKPIIDLMPDFMKFNMVEGL